MFLLFHDPFHSTIYPGAPSRLTHELLYSVLHCMLFCSRDCHRLLTTHPSLSLVLSTSATRKACTHFPLVCSTQAVHRCEFLLSPCQGTHLPCAGSPDNCLPLFLRGTPLGHAQNFPDFTPLLSEPFIRVYH